MKFVKSIAKLFVSKLGVNIGGFLVLVYFSRTLSSSQIGTFFLFQSVIGIIAIIADFGLTGAIEKRLSEGTNRSSMMSSGIVVKSILLALVSLMLILLSEHVNNYIEYNIVWILIIGLIITEYADFFRSVLIGENRVGETATLEIGRQLIWMSLGIILLSFGYELMALFYAYIVAHLGRLFLGLTKMSTNFSLPAITDVPSLFSYSKYYFISQAGGRIYSWIDIAFLGIFVSNSLIGAYEIAWRVTMLVLVLSQALADVIFPVISREAADSNLEVIEGIIPNALSVALFLSIPSLFGVIALGPEILSIVFSPEYAVASTVFVILMAEKIFQCFHRVLARVSEGLDRPKIGAHTTIISLVINIFLNIILIPILGITGAALATMISFGANTIFHGVYLSKYIHISVPYQHGIWYTISAISMMVLLHLLESLVSIRKVPELVLFVLLGVVIYTIVVSMNSHLRSSMIRIIKSF